MNIGYKNTLTSLISINALTNLANPQNGTFVNDAVYDLINVNSQWQIQQQSKRTIVSLGTTTQNNIIVILESPHVNEFDSAGQGLMPLMKDDLFVKKFIPLLFKSSLNIILNPSTTYHIYLINTIRYQCSLGFPTGYYRDYNSYIIGKIAIWILKLD